MWIVRYVGIKGKCWNEIKRICRTRFKDCYTCPSKDLVGQNAQAGHFLPVALVGSNNTLSWDLVQIRLQCGRCNGAGQGMQVVFREKLVLELGEEAVREIEKRRWKVDPVKNFNELLAELKAL